MAWKLIEVPDDDPEALTDEEMVGVGIKLSGDEPEHAWNPFYRAFLKIRPAFLVARERWRS